MFKLLRTPAFRFIVINHNYYGFVRQIREDLQTRYPDRPIHSMDAEEADFRSFSDAYEILDGGFFLIENFEQIFKPSKQADLQANRTSLIKGINRTRDRLALKPIALIVFMLHSEQERYMYRLMRAMPDMWSFRSFILELRKQHEPQIPNLQMPDTATRSVHISTLGGNTQEEKLQELERLQKSLINMTDIASLKTTYKQIAQIQQDVGHYLNAVQTWQKVQDITEDAFDKNYIYIEQGDLYKTAGELTQALECYEKVSEKIKENYQQYSIILERIGDVQSNMGNLQNALDFYEKTIKINKKLLEKDPDNSEYNNGLEISYSRLGSTHGELGNWDEALTFLELSAKLAEQLYKNHPQNIDFKSNLGSSYQKLGSTHSSIGNWDKASSFFEQFNKLMEQLYESYPRNMHFKNGLAISYEKLGDTHTSLGNHGKALKFFEQYNDLSKQLNEAYPQNVDFKNGFAVSYYKLGKFYKDKMNDNHKAKPYYQKCAKIYEELTTAYPSYAEFQKNYGIVNGILEDL